MGLVHIRRNLFVAEAFSKSPFGSDILLMTRIPELVRVLKLEIEEEEEEQEDIS
jgi:predicted glycosyltransferase